MCRVQQCNLKISKMSPAFSPLAGNNSALAFLTELLIHYSGTYLLVMKEGDFRITTV